MKRTDDLRLFSLPGNEEFTTRLAALLKAEECKAEIRSFPDGESYVRVTSSVENTITVLVCTLFQPNEKLLPLYFLGKTLRSLGAKHICLVAPYLAYMRQDKVFEPGEAVTSGYFAEMICSFADSIITADSHLHRRDSLSEIYSIPNENVHAADHISSWIKGNVVAPLLIGPDIESEQWVSEVARNVEAPFIILEKVRRGDRDVSVSIPEIERYQRHTPVLVDDIISTARTMIETVKHLKNLPMRPPVCIGVHGVFAGNAYGDLLAAGVERVVTCNSIPHVSNGVDISDLFVGFIENLKRRYQTSRP